MSQQQLELHDLNAQRSNDIRMVSFSQSLSGSSVVMTSRLLADRIHMTQESPQLSFRVAHSRVGSGHRAGAFEAHPLNLHSELPWIPTLADLGVVRNIPLALAPVTERRKTFAWSV